MAKQTENNLKSKSREDRQKALDDIALEDLDKVKAHQASTSGGFPVDSEWLLLAEFAQAYGWQAYLDAKNETRDEHGNLIVDIKEMLTLIEANRKLQSIKQFKSIQSNFYGSIASKSKSPNRAFREVTKEVIKETKVFDQ